MSKRKVKNLLKGLCNLPTPGANKAPPSFPSTILGKRPPVDSSHDLDSKKAKDKSPAKSSGDSDPLSMWLETPCLISLRSLAPS
ncbi:hypothetical protein AAC387_Pa06g1587 [Persea americana]